ncbi:unnamed protein product [Coregonus sp. 'balchen']|nr:unnamed protein product [Coregonus sp. 'balchen']
MATPIQVSPRPQEGRPQEGQGVVIWDWRVMTVGCRDEVVFRTLKSGYSWCRDEVVFRTLKSGYSWWRGVVVFRTLKSGYSWWRGVVVFRTLKSGYSWWKGVVVFRTLKSGYSWWRGVVVFRTLKSGYSWWRGVVLRAFIELLHPAGGRDGEQVVGMEGGATELGSQGECCTLLCGKAEEEPGNMPTLNRLGKLCSSNRSHTVDRLTHIKHRNSVKRMSIIEDGQVAEVLYLIPKVYMQQLPYLNPNDYYLSERLIDLAPELYN